jgi:hypothetical protein
MTADRAVPARETVGAQERSGRLLSVSLDPRVVGVTAHAESAERTVEEHLTGQAAAAVG